MNWLEWKHIFKSNLIFKDQYQVLMIISKMRKFLELIIRKPFNPLSANATKWSNTLKQFVGNNGQIVLVCLTILLVVLVHDTQSNDERFMHKLYLSLHVIKKTGMGIQPTSRRKVKRFYWIIQIGLEFLPLKLKSDEIKFSFFPSPMYI